MKAIKKSGKPFKSRLKENTVKAFCINPHTGENACSFVEDESIVDLKQLSILFEDSSLNIPFEKYLSTYKKLLK